MTFTRAAAIVTGGALLVAWFAAAGSAPEQQVTPMRDPEQSTATSGPGSLAAEVEQQALRLRERLAQAPVPDVQPRNPFSFAPVRAPRRMASAPAGMVHAATVMSDAPAVAPPPALVLMGIAEEPSFEGTHRTAVIALRPAQGDPEPSRGAGGAGDELYMVMEGQLFADRYKVKTIGVDAVELEDTVTGGFRRLALR
jgi:hypothetical protein